MRRPLLFLLILALTGGCMPASSAPLAAPWRYADLLAVLPPAEGSAPGLPGASASHDLVAVYARQAGTDLQIRLDLLDIGSELDFDLYLALDNAPGGAHNLPIDGESDLAWDLLISLPAVGAGEVLHASGEHLDQKEMQALRLRVQRDPFFDSVVFTFNPGASRVRLASLRLEAFITPAGSDTISDRAGPLTLQTDILGERPPQAAALLAFWNTYPAVTPAQALRRWNGAHSGPGSQRHGLKSLVEASAAARQPVLLLDLKNPTSLSALDYSGGMSAVKYLLQSGLAILPDLVPVSTGDPEHPFPPPAWAQERSLEDTLQAAARFGLPPSSILFTQQAQITQGTLAMAEGYRLVFSGGGNPEEPCCLFQRVQNLVQIALPLDAPAVEAADQQATSQGLSIAARRMLLENALANELASEPGSPAIVLLGGSLPESTWGEPGQAMNTMRWIAAHPWIKTLNQTELLEQSRLALRRLPAEQAAQDTAVPAHGSAPDIEPLQASVLESLRSAPTGRASQAAWQFYSTLFAPVSPDPPALESLRAAYLGQVGHLLAAARWEDEPPIQPVVDCSLDLDWDGEPECILASDEFFSVIETRGGYMTFAFARHQNGVHQWVGPSSQFLVGMSDPSVWKPEQGVAGDPGQLRGAFSEVRAGFSNPSWDTFTYQTAEREITFTAPDGSVTKTFRLVPGGLEVEYQAASLLNVHIPLVVDPWLRFEPGWASRYQALPVEGGWAWGAAGEATVIVRSQLDTVEKTFIDSRSVISVPENPNYDYPPGHFLPFPAAWLELTGEGRFEIKLTQ